jgi:hypothetical protein
LSCVGRPERRLATSGSVAGTVDALLRWWLTTYSAGAPSHARNKYSVEKHLIGSELGSLRHVEVSGPPSRNWP